VLNKPVSHNPVTTRLRRDILNDLRSRGVTLTLAFISMLKRHHELEGLISPWMARSPPG
jgi:hypothetical protein